MNAIPQVNSALAAHAAGKLRADERLANARAFAARALGAGAILAGTGAALGLAFWGYAQIGAPVAPFAFTTYFLMTTQCSFGGSSSISVQTLALQRHHSCAKQVNAGTAIHAALKRLQPVDLSLRLTIAPGFQHGIANGLDVLP